MNHQTTSRRAVALVLATGALFLSACNDDDDDSAEPQGTEVTPVDTTATTQPDTEPTSTDTTEPVVTPDTSDTLAPEEEGGDPCADLRSTITTYELNDRCAFNDLSSVPHVAFEPEDPTIALTVDCKGKDERKSIEILAASRVIISADAAIRDEARETVEGELVSRGFVVEDVSDPDNETFVILDLVGEMDDDQLIELVNDLPSLQGVGYSVDLDHLEPLLPNYAYRPADDPRPVEEGEATAPGGPALGAAAGGESRRVLVVDSTDQTDEYDTPLPNGLVDEDHGHGSFIVELIKRVAANANQTVDLEPVHWSDLRAGTRWSPMWFSDSDVVTALGGPVRARDVVNLSLGGSGCVGVAMRLPLLRELNRLLLEFPEEEPTFVVAAGNDGAAPEGDPTRLHFPAAFRDVDAFVEMRDQIELAQESSEEGIAAGTNVLELVCSLYPRLHAVGSGTPNAPDSFSNTGSWIDLWADGSDQISEYPVFVNGEWDTIDAKWSGTSFAAARASAAIASGWDPTSAEPWEDVESVWDGSLPTACEEF